MKNPDLNGTDKERTAVKAVIDVAYRYSAIVRACSKTANSKDREGFLKSQKERVRLEKALAALAAQLDPNDRHNKQGGQ